MTIRGQFAQRPENKGQRSLWPRILIFGCVVTILIALLLPRSKKLSNASRTFADPKSLSIRTSESQVTRSSRLQTSKAAPTMTAEEIVSHKLNRFAHGRRDLVYAMAEKFKVGVIGDVQRFFDAAESGRYDEMEALFKSLKAMRFDTDGHGLVPYWRAIVEVAGAAEQVHTWPAQRLLDYGEAVLTSLRPGMVYLGGTDPGCFIPTFLNDTAEAEPHVVLTQNALADSSYLQYLSFLYGDQFANLTHEDQQAAMDAYLADYRARLAHDQQFPEEPKQVLGGENVNGDNASGQVSVMAINERLVEMLLQKNPNLSFALEESFPLKSTYPEATPLGPLMELHPSDGQGILTSDAATQSLDYWQSTAQQVLSDPQATGADWTKAYAKMVESQGNLFASHNLNGQAERAYQLALQLSPSLSEAVFGYVDLLQHENRTPEAVAIAQVAAQASPDNRQLQDLVNQLQNSSHSKN